MIKRFAVLLNDEHIGTVPTSDPNNAIEIVCRYKMLDLKKLKDKIKAVEVKKAKKK